MYLQNCSTLLFPLCIMYLSKILILKLILQFSSFQNTHKIWRNKTIQYTFVSTVKSNCQGWINQVERNLSNGTGMVKNSKISHFNHYRFLIQQRSQIQNIWLNNWFQVSCSLLAMVRWSISFKIILLDINYLIIQSADAKQYLSGYS